MSKKRLSGLFVPIMLFGAGLFTLMGIISCSEDEPYLDGATQDQLTVSPTSQKIASDGTASFTFSIMLTKPNGKVIDLKETNTTATISFEATNGTVSPTSATTDENGKVTVTFTTSDPENFTGGTVKGTVKNVKGAVDQQGDLATATAEVLPLDAKDPTGDDPIKKAEALKDNTYSIQKTGGEAQVFDFQQEYSSWYVGTSRLDMTQQSIHVELMDEDTIQATMGWFNAEIPLDVANKLTTINNDFCNKYSWSYAKFGTMRLGQNNMLDAHMGKGGNVKLNGSCQFWLKEKSSKAYSGDYQLLFVFVFENQTWDEESQTYLPGDEYTICCNANVSELVADLSYFSLDYRNNWVAPGQSITLSPYWTPGATFDRSKVQLTSQSIGGSSGEWFSWDASTYELYAKASADNQEVQLTFTYSGTDLTYTVILFNGPGYTSFALSPKNGSGSLIVENDPQGWSSDDYVYISANEWTPQDYHFFNYHSIEIDPASGHYDQLYFNSYGPYVEFDHTIPEGDFNIIFRSKSDNNVKCTVPVKMVKHKVKSFQITYKHSNGSFEPWTSGGENGTCNYGMGMEVGVITVPEDAYWDWSLVELEPGYDTNFSFSGHGGRDDHPKLMLKTSHGSESYGTQVKFRLKYNYDKTSTIYVDHN
jgi:hypothetical protein